MKYWFVESEPMAYSGSILGMVETNVETTRKVSNKSKQAGGERVIAVWRPVFLRNHFSFYTVVLVTLNQQGKYQIFSLCFEWRAGITNKKNLENFNLKALLF